MNQVTATSPMKGHEIGCLCHCRGSSGDEMCWTHGIKPCTPCTCFEIIKAQRDELMAKLEALNTLDSDERELFLLQAIKSGEVTSKSVLMAAKAEAEYWKREATLIKGPLIVK